MRLLAVVKTVNIASDVVNGLLMIGVITLLNVSHF